MTTNLCKMILTASLLLFATGLVFLGGCESQPEQFETAVRETENRTEIVETEWPLAEDNQGGDIIEEEVAPQQATPKAAEPPAAQPAPKPTRNYYFQAGAFINKNNAVRLVDKLKRKGYDAYMETSRFKNKTWNLVRVGPFQSKEKAFNSARTFSEKEEMNAIVMFNGSVIKNIVTRKKASAPQKSSKTRIASESKKPVSSSIEKSATPVIPYKASPTSGKTDTLFSFQIGGLYSAENAKKQMTKFQKKGYSPYLIEVKDEISQEKWYSVRVGKYATLSDAVDAAARFTEQEHLPAQARPLSD